MTIEDVTGKPPYEIDAIISLMRSFGYKVAHHVTGRWVKRGSKRYEEEVILY